MGNKQFHAHIAQYRKKYRKSDNDKFGKLLEYNMKNIFLKKLCTECSGETSLRLFSKKLKLSISLDQ